MDCNGDGVFVDRGHGSADPAASRCLNHNLRHGNGNRLEFLWVQHGMDDGWGIFHVLLWLDKGDV